LTDAGQTTRILIKCIEPQQCSVVFEPYGAEYVLMADDQLWLEFESSEEVTLELAYSPGCISVWLPDLVVSPRAINRLGEPVDLWLPP
jgi:hypothetical protein